MTIIPPFLHRKSLAVAITLLPLSAFLSLVTSPVLVRFEFIDATVYVRSAIGSGVVILFCGMAWVNLIRDVGRGYSPSRCSLAVLLLLGASLCPIFPFLLAVRKLFF